MGADGKQAHRDRPVAIFERPLDDGFLGQQRLQFAPKPDPLQKRAGRVDARQAVGERRVHVEMRIDEGRRDEIAGYVDGLPGVGADRRFDRRDPVAGNRDVGCLPIRQHAALEENVETHLSPFW
jgi:hypothetical protein